METEVENTEQNLIREVSLPLHSSKGWVKFLGILMIIYGALIALSIVGIVIAWLPIWLGVLLNKTANNIEEAYRAGDSKAMVKAQNNLSTYFTVYGVLALIGIIITVVFFIIMATTGMMYNFQDMIHQSY